jgi:hypothetical protein
MKSPLGYSFSSRSNVKAAGDLTPAGSGTILNSVAKSCKFSLSEPGAAVDQGLSKRLLLVEATVGVSS